jgi:D-beta-D-heptose 7-phosphate kinase/D-beta-D-heptose 1-phosphate adenosyltransferase
MTEFSQLAEDAQKLSEGHVLCCGDLMLDQFVYGSVDRISPEAPIPVLRINHETATVGGAGNVAHNLTALMAKCTFLSVVGDDTTGREVTHLLGGLDHVDAFLQVQRGRQTTFKTRYISGSHHLLRADRETIEDISESQQQEVISAAGDVIDQCNALVLSDYGKGVLTQTVIEQLIALARSKNVPVVVDPKGRNYEKYRGATILTPNRRELSEATGARVETDAEIIAAANHLITSCGVEMVLVTRSQQGMTLVQKDGTFHHLPAEAREVYDVSGAGDTVVATLAAGLGAGLPVLTAAKLANIAAAIVVGKLGTAVVHAHDLVSALHHQELVSTEEKWVNLDLAKDYRDIWRAKGLRVGFTNGCFDLLHPGHISLLKQCRARCDKLIVAMNSDESVKRLKGESRPVQNEAARATVLGSLEMVDLVVIFDQDTPLELIRSLKPDLLVKGADYTVEQVVGAQDVQAYGGEVYLATLENGHSTTNTIKRLVTS